VGNNTFPSTAAFLGSAAFGLRMQLPLVTDWKEPV